MFDERTAGAFGRRPFVSLGTLAAVACSVASCEGGASGPVKTAAARPSQDATLATAARSMEQTGSYSFAGTIVIASALVHITGRFQAPDRVDETVTVPGRSPFEVILAGTDSFVRDPGSAVWRRTSASGTSADPRAAFAVLTQATGVTGSAGEYGFGVPPSAVRRLLSGLSPTGSGTGSARISGGRITHLSLHLTADNRPVSITLDYGSIGSAPPVTVPAGV